MDIIILTNNGDLSFGCGGFPAAVAACMDLGCFAAGSIIAKLLASCGPHGFRLFWLRGLLDIGDI